MSIHTPSMRELLRVRFPEFKEAWLMHTIKYGELEVENIENAIALVHYGNIMSIGHYEAVADLMRIILVLSKSNDYYIVMVFVPLELFSDPFIVKEFGPLNTSGEKPHNLQLDRMDKLPMF